MSNTVTYDSLLVHYLARELHERLAGRRLRAIRMDPETRRLTLELEDERLVWELHPARGGIRVVGRELHAEAAEGWGGRELPIARRPRIRRVRAPADERWLELELDASGGGRARRLVIELMTNQWNALGLSADGIILAALWTRDAGRRALRPGRPYQEPGGAGPDAAGVVSGPPVREGADEPLDAGRWEELLGGLDPEQRKRTLVARVAWTSPLNAGAILGAAAEGGATDGAEDGRLLRDAWRRYAALAARPAPRPRLLPLRVAQPYPIPLPGVEGRPATSLLAAFQAAAGERGSATLAPEVRAALEERLRRVRTRAERLHGEAESAPSKAAALRRRGDLLMAQLHTIRRGASEAELEDFEGGRVLVALDPSLTPAENAQVLYDRARKRERAAERLPERVREAVAEQNRLESLLESLESGEADAAEVERWLATVRPESGDGTDGEDRLPYRRFRSSGGLEIRVGRSGRGNDDLTFHHSAPDDIWLHARDVAGAHVILRWGDREQNPPKRDLLEAAVLAALGSRARTSGTVPVDWTRRKYVRKPRKAPPGAVAPERVSTVFVQPDPDLPDRLRRE